MCEAAEADRRREAGAGWVRWRRGSAGAPCWPTFEWRGSSGRHFSSAGPSSRRRHARAHTHPRLPPVHVSSCCPLELVHQRSNAPPTAQPPPGSRNPTRFVAGTATLTGDLCRSFREEVSTSRPSAARAPAPRGSHRSTSRRAPQRSTHPLPSPLQPQPGPIRGRICDFNRGRAQEFPGGGEYKPSQCCLGCIRPIV